MTTPGSRKADHSSDPEPLRQRDDGVAERTPVVIRLRAVEHEDVVSGCVAIGNERDLRPVEPDVDPFDDVHCWATSTVVEEPSVSNSATVTGAICPRMVSVASWAHRPASIQPVRWINNTGSCRFGEPCRV